MPILKEEEKKYLTIPSDCSGDSYYRFFRLNSIVKEILKKKSSNKITIVDIGSGNGYLMKYIKENNDASIEFQFIGIDKYVTEKSFDFELINQDVEGKLDIIDQSVDIVIAAEIIEHISNTDGLIEEIYRIMKKDGDAIITTPNLSSYFNRFLLLFGYQPYHSEVSNKESGFGLDLVYKVLGRSKHGNKTAGHLRMFTLRALRDFIDFYGFKIIKFYPVYFSSFRKDNNRQVLIKTFFTFDKMISSLFPSLATGLIVHFNKR